MTYHEDKSARIVFVREKIQEHAPEVSSHRNWCSLLEEFSLEEMGKEEMEKGNESSPSSSSPLIVRRFQQKKFHQEKKNVAGSG